MKNFFNKFFVLVCSLSLTLGCFVYTAPEADAFAISPYAIGSAVNSVLASYGYSFAVNGMSEGGAAVAMYNRISQYLEETKVSESVQAWIDVGTNILFRAPGTFVFTQESTHKIADFVSWLVSSLSLSDAAAGSSGLVQSNELVYTYPDGTLGNIYSPYISMNVGDTIQLTSSGSYFTLASAEIVDPDPTDYGFKAVFRRVLCLADGTPVSDYDYTLNMSTRDVDGETPVITGFEIRFRPLTDADRAESSLIKPTHVFCADIKATFNNGLCVVNKPHAIYWKQTVTDQLGITLPSSGTMSVVVPDVVSVPAYDTMTTNQVLAVDTGLTATDVDSLAASVDSALQVGTLSAQYTITDADSGVVEEDASLLSWTKKIWQAVTDIPAAIGEKLAAIPSAIADAIAAVFAPDAALINEISSTFNEKFGFLQTLHTVGNDLLNMDADTAPPVVYIHLEDAEGSVVWGGTEKVLDMSWYQRYKADVDTILSGFLWVAFLWLLFKRAPDILSGAGLVERESNDIYMAESPDSLGGFLARRKRH